eukprot:8663718-Prorocentrum_lima.AAC.1
MVGAGIDAALPRWRRTEIKRFHGHAKQQLDLLVHVWLAAMVVTKGSRAAAFLSRSHCGELL